MTADHDPGHDPDRAARDARREQERAASRDRQHAAYRQAQRASRSRALRAAADDTASTGPAASPRKAEPALPTELSVIELVEQRLEEAELQQALLDALAALPAEQRVAVVAALGYAEGPAGAAMELDIDSSDAEQLAEQGLDALRHALSPFLTRD